MTPKVAGSGRGKRPRIGVPWRTEKQELARDMRRNRDYLAAVRTAGGEPLQLSLRWPRAELKKFIETLDAFVLPGSPADITPKLFGERAHAKAAKPDLKREKTDFALLRHALATGKPVLAICYGVQSLNVFCGGSLYQDIPSEVPRALVHSSRDDHEDSTHRVRVTGRTLAGLAGKSEITVNSVHHQSVRQPGRGLSVAAKAADGVIEAVEWTRGPGWALGVQWHPERTPKDALARKLFRRLVLEATSARDARSGEPARRGAAKATRAAAKAPNSRQNASSGHNARRSARVGRRK